LLHVLVTVAATKLTSLCTATIPAVAGGTTDVTRRPGSVARRSLHDLHARVLGELDVAVDQVMREVIAVLCSR
jgi:hypothetical protein